MNLDLLPTPLLRAGESFFGRKLKSGKRVTARVRLNAPEPDLLANWTARIYDARIGDDGNPTAFFVRLRFVGAQVFEFTVSADAFDGSAQGATLFRQTFEAQRDAQNITGAWIVTGQEVALVRARLWLSRHDAEPEVTP